MSEKLGTWQKVAVAIMLSAFLISGGFGQLAEAAQKGPIKIGFILPYTGNFGQLGKDMIDGFKMALEENNYTIAGRKAELIIEDEVNPNVAVTKARKLIRHDKVHFIAGILLSSSAYSVAPICIQAKVPFIITQASGDDLTQRKRNPYVLRLAQTACEAGHAAGDFAYKKLGWRTAVTIGFDYAWGHESIGGMHAAFEDNGGKIVQKIWVPIGTTDFGPYAASLKREGVDGCFDNVTGAASVRLIRLLRAGARPWEIVGNGPIADETMHEALGDAGVGVYSSWPYSIAQPNRYMAEWRVKARKYLGREPTGYVAMQYSCADWIIRALKAIDGDVEDSMKFLNTLRTIEIPDNIRGPVTVDKYGHPIQNMYIRRMDKIGNTYQNTVVDVYPMIGQFWKWDPEEFMKKPVYSRVYPECKYCK
jgi:branched-chain amino acid transport system substrate-binding protein